MTDFSRLSIVDIQQQIAGNAFSAVDVCTQILERIAAYDAIQPAIWIERFSDAAIMEQAMRVDARIAAGEKLPLAGAPFAVKDNLDVAGLATTAACPAFSYRPERSATVVERLQAAGAIAIGKTNLDQFATGLVGTRTPYGALGCVYNQDYVSGGSSSGSAAATAAGLVAFALGTDTAGSGRVPASFNHLLGFKPTKGRWSTRGLVPACRSLDCVSVFTSTAADARLIDDALAIFDSEDSYSRPTGNAAAIGRPPRIGVASPDQLNWLGDTESAALYADALKRFENQRPAWVEVDIAPLLEAASLLYDGPWVAERTASIEELLRADPAAIHPVVRAIAQRGLTMSAVDAFKGQYKLQAYTRAAQAIWEDVDFLLLPTAATIYPIADVLADPVKLNSNLGLYTNFVNLLDMSAVAIPAGFRRNGTGFGITLLGPAWADRALIDMAHAYETASPMPSAPALDLDPRPRGVKLAVVGAHLRGMPLHGQLESRGARLVRVTRTAPVYRFYAMVGTTPQKPALIHVGPGGGAIDIEIYELSFEAFGSFVNEIPPPLAIGTVTTEDGAQVKGFVAEPRAMEGARDITELGGWRAYIASVSKPSGAG